MEVLCIPESIGMNEPFHTTIRWCLQRPRRHHVTFDLLDMNEKVYLGGGEGLTPEGETQCGVHTFLVNGLNADSDDIMWKYFITPVFGSEEEGDEWTEPFPNMIAETGIEFQPEYNGLVGDCEVVEDEFWNLEPDQDSIEFNQISECLVPGMPWEVSVDVHLENHETADLHVNLQIGTGADVYLGDNDIYLNGKVFEVEQNGGNMYWRRFVARFSAVDTMQVEDYETPYISAFMVPSGDVYEEGWDIIDQEFTLNIQKCQ